MQYCVGFCRNYRCSVGTAAAAADSSLCETSAIAGRLLSASTGEQRNGDMREPDLGEVHEDLPASAKGKANDQFKATVPVYFHVVTDGTIGASPTPPIAVQIDVLNDTYAGGEGGAESGFRFKLVGVTRTDNADWFYTGPGGNAEHSMKQALHQGGNDALNVYSTTAGPYLGWAYLPSIVTKPGQAYLDGVVIDWESMARHVDHVRRSLRPGRDRYPRGRSLVEPRAHLLRRMQRQGRLRRRHTRPEDADGRLP